MWREFWYAVLSYESISAPLVTVVMHIKYNEDYPQDMSYAWFEGFIKRMEEEGKTEKPYCLRGTDLADIYEIIDVFRVCTLLHQL